MTLLWISIAIILLGMAIVLLLGWFYSEVDWGNPWLRPIDGINRLFCRRYHRLKGGLDTLPDSGPAVVVANHLSGLDPLLLIAASRRPLRFLIAKEEYHRFGMEWLFRAVGCIPVDRDRRPERAFRVAIEAIKRGEVVALFPHGGIRLDSEPSRPLKPGAVRLAQLASAPIIPVRIDGIKGEGDVAMAVIKRSHAYIKTFSPILCADSHKSDCLDRVRELIEKRK